VSRARKRKPNAAAATTAAVGAVLGDVPPGDWATLASGDEVMVSWHQRCSTFVRRAGAEPDPLPSSTPIIGVRHRVRLVAQVDAVADPVGGAS
jgi:hypothetical protein